MKKKIIVIDDHKIIRDGLYAIFKIHKQYEVIAGFDNEEDLFDFLSMNQTDLVLMDLHLNSSNGLDLTRRLKTEHPEIKVIMHTMADRLRYIEEAKKIGAEGYVLKSGGQEQLEEALNTVLNENKCYYPFLS